MCSDRTNITIDLALDEAIDNYEQSHPESRVYFDKAKQVMPGGNTRTVLHYGPYPFVVAKGVGANIVDVDGKTYSDFLGEYTAGLYGHNNEIIETAVVNALKQGVTLGGPTLTEAKFAKLLCDRFPAVDRLRFCNSGTESNVLALSAARAFTNREAIVVVDGSYHGGVLSFSGDSPINVPYPTHRIPYNNIDAAVSCIESLGTQLAAVLVEPMIGAGGCIPADREYLKALRSATQQTGALLIFDEVMTSRLTAHGLQGLHAINPDLTTLGKYLGGGLTFGAFGGREDIMDNFDPAKPGAWRHAGTFNNNILTMSAGLAGLSQVYTNDTANEFFERGNAWRNALAEKINALSVPVQLTGLGSMMAFHFAQSAPTAPFIPGAYATKLYELLHFDMIERGQFYSRRGMINLSIETSEAQWDAFCDCFVDVLTMRASLIRNDFI